MYDVETHDRLAKAAFDFCETVAAQYDAPNPNGAPAGQSSGTAPIPLSGSIQCTRTDETHEGKVLYTATVAWQNEFYQGALVSAMIEPLRARLELTVPVEGAFQMKLPMPTTVTLDSFALTELRLMSGPKPVEAEQEAMQDEAAETEPGTDDEMVVDEMPAGDGAEPMQAEEPVAMAAILGPIAPPPSAPPPKKAEKHAPIPLPGVFTATHKPNPKLAQGKMQFTIQLPWNDALMYPKAKLALFCAPVAKKVTVALGAKPRDGESVNITLTLPTTATASFQISGVAILSGPKPAAPSVAQALPPPPMPAVSAAAQAAAQGLAAAQAVQRTVVVARPVKTAEAKAAERQAAKEAKAAEREEARRTKAAEQEAARQAKAAEKEATRQAKEAAKEAAAKEKAAASKKRTPVAAKPKPTIAKKQPKKKPAVKKPIVTKPPKPPPPPKPPTRSGRAVNAAARFGDKGELEMRRFMSSPTPVKPAVDLAVETAVPAFATKEAVVWAMGLHAGVRKRFKARIVDIRARFPRIVVSYEADEAGGTHPLALPEMRVAWLTAADIEAVM